MREDYEIDPKLSFRESSHRNGVDVIIAVSTNLVICKRKLK